MTTHSRWINIKYTKYTHTCRCFESYKSWSTRILAVGRRAGASFITNTSNFSQFLHEKNRWSVYYIETCILRWGLTHLNIVSIFCWISTSKATASCPRALSRAANLVWVYSAKRFVWWYNASISAEFAHKTMQQPHTKKKHFLSDSNSWGHKKIWQWYFLIT